MRAELEKLRSQVRQSDKKGKNSSELKANLRHNKASLDQARLALKDGYKLIMAIAKLADEILKAFRLPSSQ